MKLVLIRHGATAWSISGQHTGRTDLALLPEGIEQANQAVGNVRAVLGAEWETAKVISSPLQRAHTTAGIIFGADRVSTDENLLEMHYGDYEGLTSPEIRVNRPDWDLWRDGNPNGETTEQVGVRCDAFLAAHVPSVVGTPSTLVVVAHAHLLRILTARALGLQAAQGRLFTLHTAATSVIEDVRGNRCVSLWNLSAEHSS
jgi:broad specificity phosphatase PhoE